MANIMVTELCNLACPYCFADEFVNKKINEISIENFHKAIDFIISSKSFSGSLGIIGGEPTLHKKFSELLTMVRSINSIKDVVIFTNGIKIDETADLLAEKKFSLLINLNSPEIIGNKNFIRIEKNIDDLIIKYKKKHSITLGLNLYEVGMKYNFYLDLLMKYKFSNARLSISVPNSKGDKDSFERFSVFKEFVYQLYIDLLYHGINPIFDCNKIPACLWTDKEIMKISLIQSNHENKRIGFNLEKNKCNPVIDILPDLTAVRCFGLSTNSKVRIGDFASLDELGDYFKEKVDAKLCKIPSINECNICEMYKDASCYGGCLANKQEMYMR